MPNPHADQQAAAKVPAQAQTDKPDPRKKTARPHSAEPLSESLALGGQTPAQGAQKTPGNKKDAAAEAAALPVAAKTATAQSGRAAGEGGGLAQQAPQRGLDSGYDGRVQRRRPENDAGVPFAPRQTGTGDVPETSLGRPRPPPPRKLRPPLDRLQDMAGSELLRATNLVLKDGGGEIRLILKPDSLGSVRVRMNLVDNVIEGKIIVDSSSVKQVVDGSIEALRRALTAEGFQTGSLQVSVGGQNTDTDARKEQEQQPQAIRRITAQGFERNIPGIENVSLGDLLVNVFV